MRIFNQTLRKDYFKKGKNQFRTFFLILLFTLINYNANASECNINHKNSHIEFLGSHIGNVFKGKFIDFTGKINFDFNNLDQSNAKILIKTDSALTKNQEYDLTLKKSDWFNVKKYPEAYFQTSKISKIKEDYYNIDGKLRIKNITLPHSFSGKIIKEEKKATLNATSAINRLDFNIGKSSDPKAEWVSNNINLNIKIECLFLK